MNSAASCLNIVAVVVLGSALLPGQSPRAGRPASVIVREIQRADYEGDRAALQRLYDELQPVAGDGRLAARVRYWRGFAQWRRALNGFNDSVPPEQLERDLTLAISEFEESALRDPAFVDAAVGTISCLQSLTFLKRSDPATVSNLVPRFVQLLKTSMAAAPENPRVLWVQGASQWYAAPGLPPAQVRERQATAMATYARGIRLARSRSPDAADPLEPAWGEPELLMNLAWSSLNGSKPDVVAAERFATEALALVPHWHYVRDVLMPQIRSVRMKELAVRQTPGNPDFAWRLRHAVD